jgi:hypothetical protein
MRITKENTKLVLTQYSCTNDQAVGRFSFRAKYDVCPLATELVYVNSGTSVYVLNPFQILGLIPNRTYTKRIFPIRNKRKMMVATAVLTLVGSRGFV